MCVDDIKPKRAINFQSFAYFKVVSVKVPYYSEEVRETENKREGVTIRSVGRRAHTGVGHCPRGADESPRDGGEGKAKPSGEQTPLPS